MKTFAEIREQMDKKSNEELKEIYSKNNHSENYNFVLACAIESIAVNRQIGNELEPF